jgi:hypothetical protein
VPKATTSDEAVEASAAVLVREEEADVRGVPVGTLLVAVHGRKEAARATVTTVAAQRSRPPWTTPWPPPLRGQEA